MGKGHRIVRSENEITGVRVIVNPEYRFTIPESIREICGIKPGAIVEFQVDPKSKDKFTVRVMLK